MNILYKKFFLKLLFLITGSIFLVACGGGGGGGGDSAITPPTGGGGSSGGSGNTSPVVISFSSSASELEIGSSATLSWSAANADQCEASGSWSGAKGASGSETFAFDAVGNYSFTLNCSNSSLSSTATVEVEAYSTISGTVLDGYIRGSEVFVDANNNTQKDSNESSVESDQNGRFEGLRIAEGSVISLGGIDANTNLPLDQFWLTTSANTDGIILSPVTTIATQLGSIETAKSSLGIADSIDILTFDPLQTLNDANAKHLYEVGVKLGVFSLTLKNFFNSSQGLTNSTATYSNLLAESLATRFDSVQSGIAVDDPTFIAAVVDNIVTSNNYNTSNTALTHLKSGLEALYFIEHKNDAAVDLGIQNFMLSTLQNDVQAMAQETISNTTVEAYTTALAAYIATDQNLTTADIDIPITANADSVQAIEDENAQNLDVFSNDKFRRSQPISLEFNTVTSNLGIIQANNTGADGIKHTSSPTNGGGTNTNPYINGISYSPKSNFCGEDSFEYTLIQGSQQSTSQVSVTVACVNDSPTVVSRSFSNSGGGTAVFANVGANDVDGDALSYSVGGTDAEFISVDGNGDLSFISSVSYSNPSDSNGDNVYEFTVTVSDGSTSVLQNFTVEVLPGGSAPIFSGTTSAASFAENSAISIQINASDPDGDPITLTINNPSGFSITSNANGFEITNSSGLSSGAYNVEGVVSDGNFNTSFSFEINVTQSPSEAPRLSLNGSDVSSSSSRRRVFLYEGNRSIYWSWDVGNDRPIANWRTDQPFFQFDNVNLSSLIIDPQNFSVEISYIQARTLDGNVHDFDSDETLRLFQIQNFSLGDCSNFSSNGGSGDRYFADFNFGASDCTVSFNLYYNRTAAFRRITSQPDFAAVGTGTFHNRMAIYEADHLRDYGPNNTSPEGIPFYDFNIKLTNADKSVEYKFTAEVAALEESPFLSALNGDNLRDEYINVDCSTNPYGSCIEYAPSLHLDTTPGERTFEFYVRDDYGGSTGRLNVTFFAFSENHFDASLISCNSISGDSFHAKCTANIPQANYDAASIGDTLKTVLRVSDTAPGRPNTTESHFPVYVTLK